jgi:hypothetical protein
MIANTVTIVEVDVRTCSRNSCVWFVFTWAVNERSISFSFFFCCCKYVNAYFELL